MKDRKKPVANPSVLLREEFDDWAVLFDPDTGHGFGLSPAGVYLWKLLDGGRSIDEMLSALRRDATDVPEEAGEQILAFVEELAQHGLVVYDVEEFHDGRECILSRTTGIAENLPDGGPDAGQFEKGTRLRYERPRLEPLTLESFAHGNCWAGSGASGGGSTYACQSTGAKATGGTDACCTGISASSASSSSCFMNGSGATKGTSLYTCWSNGSSGGACNAGAVA